MHRWRRRIAFALGVVLLVIVSRLTFLRPDPIAVSTHEVERGRVESTVVNSRAGTVQSRRRAEMSPGIAGLVAAVDVHKGQRARKGDVLLRLDDAELRAQVRLAERALDAARAAADQSCLAAEQAKRDDARAESLSKQGLLPQQELEAAHMRAETTAAACTALREQSKQAEAGVEAARATLAKTVMRAPFDGVVLDVTTEVGEWISPSPPGVFIPPVIDLIDPDSLYVVAPLDEADVARVRVDLPVRITMDAFRGQSFAGTLTYISSYVETRQEQNRTLDVEAVFNGRGPDNVLPGLSADVEVILDAKDDVLRIPTSTLLEGNRVLVVEAGRIESRAVETGIRNWEWVEIASGLTAGDHVVASLDRAEVKPGAHVRIAEEAAQ